MSDILITVERAALELSLHPKTILRYIRDGRLAATRVGKSYRIARATLDAFAGVARGRAEATRRARTTCVVDIPDLSAEGAQRLAGLLHSAALSGNTETPPLHLETVFDPSTRDIKVMMIGSVSDVRQLLELVQLQIGAPA